MNTKKKQMKQHNNMGCRCCGTPEMIRDTTAKVAQQRPYQRNNDSTSTNNIKQQRRRRRTSASCCCASHANKQQQQKSPKPRGIGGEREQLSNRSYTHAQTPKHEACLTKIKYVSKFESSRKPCNNLSRSTCCFLTCLCSRCLPRWCERETVRPAQSQGRSAHRPAWRQSPSHHPGRRW